VEQRIDWIVLLVCLLLAIALFAFTFGVVLHSI